MAITQVGSITSSSVNPLTSGASSFTLTLPTGTQAGDVIVCAVAHRSTIGWQVPTGWTKLINEGSGNTTVNTTASAASLEVFYIVQGASAPATTFNKETGTSNISSVLCVALRGVDNSSPIASSTSLTPASTTTPTTTAAVTGNSGDYILIIGGGARNGTFSAQQIVTGTVSVSELSEQGTTNGADVSVMLAGQVLTSSLNSTVSYTHSLQAVHAIGAIAFRQAITATLGINDNALQLISSTGYAYVRSASAQPGTPFTMNGTFNMIQRLGPDSWDTPSVHWCCSSTDPETGYKIAMMEPGFQMFKVGVEIDNYYTFGIVANTLYYWQLTSTDAGAITFSFGTDPASLTTIFNNTYASPLTHTGTYAYLSALQCNAVFDDITGTFADNFDLSSTGTFSNDGVWAVSSVGGGTIEIVNQSLPSAVFDDMTSSSSALVSSPVTGSLGPYTLDGMTVSATGTSSYPAWSTYSDAFSTNTIANYTVDTPTTGFTVAVTGGRLEMTPLDPSTGRSGVFKSGYSIEGDSVFCRIHPLLDSTSGDQNETTFGILDSTGANGIRFMLSDSTAFVQKKVSSDTFPGKYVTDGYWEVDASGVGYVNNPGSYVDIFVSGNPAYGDSPKYDEYHYAWFRIRRSGTTWYADTAGLYASNPPLSGEWTNRASFTQTGDFSDSMLLLNCGNGQASTEASTVGPIDITSALTARKAGWSGFTNAYLTAPAGYLNWNFSNIGLRYNLDHVTQTEVKDYLNTYIAKLTADFRAQDYDNATTLHTYPNGEHSDSDDSYAATFLDLACAYMDKYNDSTWWSANVAKLKDIAYANIAVPQKASGLVKVYKSGTPSDVGYLMDNCEVWVGIRHFADKLTALSDADASYYGAVADGVRNGINNFLWYTTGNCWFVSDLNAVPGTTFYPDCTAQVYPEVLGVANVTQAHKDAAYAYLNTNAPGWENGGYDTFPNLYLAAAAARRGDTVKAKASLHNAETMHAGASSGYVTINELGWYSLAKSLLVSASTPVGTAWFDGLNSTSSAGDEIVPISNLTDNFDDGSMSTNWTLGVSFPGQAPSTTGTTATEAGGKLVVTSVANNTGNFGGYSSSRPWVLKNSSAYVRVIKPDSNSSSMVTEFYVGPDIGDRVGFLISAGSISRRIYTDGTYVEESSLYDPEKHRWLRIIHNGTNVLMQVAPETASNPPASGDWTTLSTFSPTWDLYVCYTTIAMGHWTSGAPASTAYFDGFNTTATADNFSPYFVASSNAAATAASIVLNKPTGTATGDLLLWAVAFDKSTSITFPAGWTKAQEIKNTVNGDTLAVGWKKADATDGSTFTMTLPESNDVASIMLCYRGTNLGVSGSTSSYTGLETSSPWLFPDIYPPYAKDQAMLVWFGSVDNTTANGAMSYDPPTAFHALTNDVTEGQWSHLMASHTRNILAGTPETVNGTSYGSGTAGTSSVLLVVADNVQTRRVFVTL